MNDERESAARRNMYLFFSAAFSDPHQPRFELLEGRADRQRVAMQMKGLLDSTQGLAPTGEDELLRPGVDPDEFLVESGWDRKTITEEYKDVFGLTVSEDCPPYEVEYCEKTDLFYRSQLMADLAGFYRAFGLRRNREAPEREDHIRTQMEFMYFLFAKLSRGLEENHDPEDLETVKKARKSFFKEHVGWWIPAFGRAVENRSDSDFYADLSRLLRWFITGERLRFGLPVFDRRPEPNVPEVDPAGSCFECGVARS